MDAKQFANKLCAFLIARDTIREDSPAHEQLHAAFREFFPALETELTPKGATDEQGARQAGQGGRQGGS